MTKNEPPLPAAHSNYILNTDFLTIEAILHEIQIGIILVFWTTYNNIKKDVFIMIRILLGVIFFIIFAIGSVLLYLGINALKKAQANDDALYNKAIICLKLFILIEVINGIFFIICLVVLK